MQSLLLMRLITVIIFHFIFPKDKLTCKIMESVCLFIKLFDSGLAYLAFLTRKFGSGTKQMENHAVNLTRAKLTHF